MSADDSPQLPISLEHLFADKPEVRTLENGLTVVFQKSATQPIVSAQAWIRTGSIHESPHLGSGLSHFLEHMLFKGTGKRGPGEIAREVQSRGGQINAYTAFDRTVVFIDGPSEGLAHSLDLLADMTLGAALPETEVEKEKGVILREIDMTLDDPDRILSRGLFSTAYREHPFRFPVIGLRPLFEHVDREMLLSYYKERYQPNNMILSVVGDVEEDALMEALADTFGEVPRGSGSALVLPPEPRQLAPRECRLSGDYQIARGLMAFKIPSMRHPDAPGLDIIGAILGSGFTGRLRRQLRDERGLVHGIAASSWNPGDPGLFFIQYQCDPDKAVAAEEAIRETFAGLGRTGFSPEELEKARRFALVSEIQSRQTISGLASRLGLVTALVGDVGYPRRFFERIHQLTTDDLAALAGRCFVDDQLTVATLLPKRTEAARRPQQLAHKPNPFEEILLDNGARIFWQQDKRLPRACMRFAGLGGPLFEDPARRGATSLMATLLTKDTGFRSAHEVALALEKDGGFMVDASGNNSFALAVEVLPEKSGDGLHALEEAVLHPAFREETVLREREAQLAHIRELEDDILDCGRLALRRHFFGSHPFASDPAGSLDSVGQLGPEHLRAFHKRLVTAGNTVLVMAGDFDPDALLPRAVAFLKQLPEEHAWYPDTTDPLPARRGTVSEFLDREQTVAFDAFPDMGFKPDGEVVGEVLDEMLSDMSGPLFHAVREKNSLAYFVGASRLLGHNFGSFFLYAGTHPSTVDQVFHNFDAELERLRSGQINKAEFDSARTRLKVHARFSLQNPANRAARAALNALYGKPVMDWIHYEERLDALTRDDLTRFANQYLVPEKRLRLTIGPKI